MRLVACPSCHTQYDVSGVEAASIPCRCGETLANRPPAAVDARIHRCGSCGALVAPQDSGCDYCGSEIVREPAKLSLICPECYARCPDDARFCTACGVGFRPEKPALEGPELSCPACEAAMATRELDGLALHECLGCRGLWVPGEGFEQLVSRASEARDRTPAARPESPLPRVAGGNPAAQRVRYRKCPRCRDLMQRRNFRRSSGIVIDVCRGCGTWLDADELEAVAGFILGGGPAVQPPLEELPRPGAERARSAASRAHSSGLFERRGPGGPRSMADALFALLQGGSKWD